MAFNSIQDQLGTWKGELLDPLPHFQFYPRSTWHSDGRGPQGYGALSILSKINREKGFTASVRLVLLSILSKINVRYVFRIREPRSSFNSIQDQQENATRAYRVEEPRFQFYPRSTLAYSLRTRLWRWNLSILSKINCNLSLLPQKVGLWLSILSKINRL